MSGNSTSWKINAFGCNMFPNCKNKYHKITMKVKDYLYFDNLTKQTGQLIVKLYITIVTY